MKPIANNFARRNQIIAGLLWYGTWFATALIAVGVLLSIFEPLHSALVLPISGYDAVKAGIGVFILLPVARVALMLLIFLRERDYVYVAIAALVLAIIVAGVFIDA
ncbi:MAG: DUF1634 domain-containing protein [Stenotrophomonas maltophilia]